MRHLRPEEFVELAEGAPAGPLSAHLDDCEACRRKVSELRAALTAVQDADVPEPSPLFWEHLSANVRERVAAETTTPRRHWALGPPAWPVLVRGFAGALVVLAAVLAIRFNRGQSAEPANHLAREAVIPAASADQDVVALLEGSPGAYDDSFRLMSELASDLDWDDAAAAGLGTSGVVIDGAVGELNAAERLELQRLLTNELSRAGTS